MILEPVQGEGGFIPMPADFPARLRELCDRHGILWIDDEVQAGVGRTGPVWAIEHYDAQPDLLVSGKSLGGGLPLAGGHRAGGDHGRGRPGRARRHVRRQPGLLRGGQRRARHGAGACGRERGAGRAAARRPGRTSPTRVDAIGEVRGLGPMLALELVRDRESKTPAPERVAAAIAAAREQGLLLLGCGLHGNVIRLLPPLTISDDDLARGLEILEAALA